MRPRSRCSRRPGGRWSLCVLTTAVLAIVAVATLVETAVATPLPGRLQWGHWYNGAANGDDGYKALATWPDGTSCAVGYVTSVGEARNIVVVKYSPGGGLRRWTKTYDNDAVHGDDIGRAVVVDPKKGSVFVAGTSVGAGGIADVVLIKYTVGGKRVWVRRFAPDGHGGANVGGMKLDGDGNVVFAASIVRAGTGTDWAIVKYDRGGHLKWSRWYTGPGAGADNVYDLAVDSSGRIYATGSSDQGATGWDATTACWSAGGVRRWARTIARSGALGDQANAIALGDAAVYVAGYSNGGVKDDALLARYSRTGTRRWVRYWDDPDHERDSAQDLAVDGAGNAYLVGFGRTTAGDQQGVVVKYSRAGSRRWQRFSGEAGIERSWTRVGFNRRTGRLVVVGDNDTAADPRKIVLASYSSAGTLRWQRFYDGPDDLDTSVGDLALWGAYFFFCGTTDTTTDALDALVCKYSQ